MKANSIQKEKERGKSKSYESSPVSESIEKTSDQGKSHIQINIDYDTANTDMHRGS